MAKNLMAKHFNDLFHQLQGQVIAHRGAPRLAPENTAASFKKAALLNAKWVEFDTQLSGSGEWVIIHDETLERTSNGHGPVDALSFNELKKLDAGSWFHPSFKEERILLLSDALNLLSTLKLSPNIEIKCKNTPNAKELSSFLDILEKSDFASKTFLLSSFDFETLKLLQKENKKLPMGYIVEEIEETTIKRVKDANLFSLHCNYENLQTDQIKEIVQQDLALLLYTVNDPKQAKHFFELGVCSIFSDIPNLLDPHFY